MKNRITELFKNKKKDILSIFFTAGYPKLEDTASIATYLQQEGVDLIEIGIPFSDPVADGPTIQASNKVALDNGMNVKLLLEQVREIRKQVSIPIVLMGYLNPVFQYGVEKFLKEAKAAGADGVILPDMPLYEFESTYKSMLEENELSVAFLISPTTSEERIRKIDSLSNGFIYAVSASSTTGAKSTFSDEQIQYFKKLSKLSLKNPFLIGFGISDHATFTIASTYASGAIIGSAFIKAIDNSNELKKDIHTFINGIRNSTLTTV